jgi:tetratricopeptide (TPR) repeat protein
MFRDAVALHQAGRLREAEKLYRALLKLDPTEFGCLHGLGRLCFREGRAEEAAKWLHRAVSQNKKSAAARCDLGAALARLDRHQDAIRSYEAALAIEPDHALTLFNMGTALHALGRPDQAIPHFERAISLAPNVAETHNSLGLSLASLERHAAALACYQQAIAIRPGYVPAHCNVGLALRSLNRPAEALAHYWNAIALAADQAEAHEGLGAALEALGSIDEARRAYEKAIELAPAWGLAHRSLAECTRYSAGNPHLALMEALARDPKGVMTTQRVHLHAALAKAYADLEDYGRASRHMIDGNRLQRRRIAYDEDSTLAVFDRVAGVFTAEFIRRNQGSGAASDLPVFVVGMPRSGSTLIEQILASHPKVHGAGEVPHFGDAVASLGHGHFASDTFLGGLPSISGPQLQLIGARYLAEMTSLGAGKERVTNKLLGNFVCLGLIHLALPQARIVHARRNAIDTCLSRFSKIFVPGQAYSYDLAELGRYHRAYERLMAHWREVLPPGTMIDVDYEAVVADLDGEARRIVAFCGLEWDDACLAFHRTQRPVMTPSKSQVRQPIYATAVGRWHPYEEMLRPLLKVLGTESAAGPG